MSVLNDRAYELCEALAADAARLAISVHTLPCGTRLIDCGVAAAGGFEAGRRLAEVCLAGLGEVRLEHDNSIVVATDQPLAACMASQYAGWEIKGEGYFAMGSGPMRAAAGREELFDHIGHRETADRCVGVLETAKLPPDDVCRDIAARCGIAPDRLTLLAARTASPAGTLQIVARSIETALHKLHELGFGLARVERGWGAAPLPPVAPDDLTAIGWTNDAILYGGHAKLWVGGDEASLASIGPRVPSMASPDHGRPFAEIFARYDRDFYRIDPLLFSPAVVTFIHIESGRELSFGRFEPEVLAESFGG